MTSPNPTNTSLALPVRAAACIIGGILVAWCFASEWSTYRGLRAARQLLDQGEGAVLVSELAKGDYVPVQLLIRRSNLARETLRPALLAQAEADAKWAVSLDPLNSAAWRRLAEAYLYQQKREKGEAALETALRLEPAYAELKRSSIKLFALLQNNDRLEQVIDELNHPKAGLVELFDELVLLRRNPSSIAKRLDLSALSIQEVDALFIRLNRRGRALPVRDLWGLVPIRWFDSEVIRTKSLHRALKAYDLPILAILWQWHSAGKAPDAWPKLRDTEAGGTLAAELLDTSLENLPWESAFRGFGWQVPPANKALEVMWRPTSNRDRVTLLSRRRDSTEDKPEILLELTGNAGKNFNWPLFYFLVPANRPTTVSLEIEASSYSSPADAAIILSSGRERANWSVQSTLSREWQSVQLTLDPAPEPRIAQLEFRTTGQGGKLLGKGRLRLRDIRINFEVFAPPSEGENNDESGASEY